MNGLNPAQHISNVRRDFETFDQGGIVSEHEIQLWDGSYLVCVCPVLGYHNKRVMAISVTLTNITRHKNLEKKLSGLVGQLIIENEDVRRLSETDALTSLGNRRALDLGLDKAIHGAVGRGEEVSLLIIDVDNFKAYNDLYGHPAGDQCLQRIAEAINYCLQRPDDMAVRFGGEEFVVLLPHTSAEGAIQVAESIRNKIIVVNIPHTRSAQGVVTVSIGIASYKPRYRKNTDRGEISKGLLTAADTALYRAKQAGRNRVINNGYI